MPISDLISRSMRGANSSSLFEIRLDKEVIVLRGPENEAASQILSGVVVLCLPHSLKVDNINLKLSGISKVEWSDILELNGSKPMSRAGGRNEKKVEILNHRWSPFIGSLDPSTKSVTLPAGNYEWPFEFVVPGCSTESVEGLEGPYITYKLKATVARGKLAANLHTYKPVRIVRTLDSAALELSHAMSVASIWANKIEYELLIPTKAVVFGTNIPIEIKITSLLKGLRIGKISCELVELIKLCFSTRALHDSASSKVEKTIASWGFEMNDDEHYQDMMTMEGQDGYVMKQNLHLPKSLGQCRQDVETNTIKISHKVKFNIQLHNPDGHVSELRAKLPVFLFISPNMPLDEGGNLVDQTPNSVESTDIHSHAPPLYGDHILDQLYANSEPLGLRSPAAQSGVNTPFYSHSQIGSSDSISDMAGGGAHPFPADALESRLQRLSGRSRANTRNADSSHTGFIHADDSRRSSSAEEDSIPRSAPTSGPTSGIMSRRASEEGDTLDVAHHIDYADLELHKVPSYNTAKRAPARAMSSRDLTSLPDYETALSQPPSPTLGHGALHGRPGQGERIASAGSASEMRSGGFAGPTSDAERRVFLMQIRGR